MDDALRVAVVLGLVAANAFFVIGEYAVVTARRSALAPRAERGHRGARAALRLMDNPVRVISTVQVGITAIGILTGALGEPLVRDLLGDWLPVWAGVVIAFLIITYLTVVLGELVPKALTLERSGALAVLVARPIELVARVLRPAVWVLQGSAAVLLRPFGVREVVAGESIRSADELRALVDEAEGAGVIPRAQEELLYNVLRFPEREARDVMVPAPAVATAGIVTIEDVLEQLVGEIEDEFDLPDATLTWLDARTLQASGSMTIDDANEELGLRLPQRGPRTLAGLVFDELGRRPGTGDTVEVEGVGFLVEAMEGLRIVRLRITLPAADAADTHE